MKIFCLFLIVLCLACQQEDDPSPPQIIIYETEQSQPQRESETITVVLVKEDKSPPQLMNASVNDAQEDVNVGKINQHGLVFEYNELLHKDSKVWIETEGGDNLGWNTIVHGKMIELLLVGNNRLKRNAIYVVRLNVSDLSGNAARKRTIVFST